MECSVAKFWRFNCIRFRSERTCQTFSRRESKDFNAFIEKISLLEFEKLGPWFSFLNELDTLSTDLQQVRPLPC